ncbi:hypothetical protein [Streptacidiphilus jiangxiensis]|uniref:Uncharacterized protein n=1 Tax=Streptacidiphilus jiangxiensis TaxID=235985 RepID=A0A1H7P9B4_STRJI|nr:hypothetical protein [Streptacidiphilus jiangxiensis]SEL31845.1 hypothetical protein SAMN05414137_107260 [Streptacidiphilus jiangxiensis]
MRVRIYLDEDPARTLGEIQAKDPALYVAVKEKLSTVEADPYFAGDQVDEFGDVLSAAVGPVAVEWFIAPEDAAGAVEVTVTRLVWAGLT